MLVETAGNYMLLDPYNGQEIEATGATEVAVTQFVRERLDSGQLVEIKPVKAKPQSKE